MAYKTRWEYRDEGMEIVAETLKAVALGKMSRPAATVSILGFIARMLVMISEQLEGEG